MNQRNNSATLPDSDTLMSIQDEVSALVRRVEELVNLSKATRERAAATRELMPREQIMAALEEKDAAGKMRGRMTMSEVKALLHLSNSSVKLHVDGLVKEGRVVIITRLGESGRMRAEVVHASAYAV